MEKCTCNKSGTTNDLVGEVVLDPSRLNELIQHTAGRMKVHASRMLRIDFAKLGRDQETWDVVNEAVVKLYESLLANPVACACHYYRRSGWHMRNWLHDLARRYQRRAERAASDSPLESIPDWTDPVTFEEWEALHASVFQLPAELREVFNLIYYQGLNKAMVAELLDISIKTVERRYRSAQHEISRLVSR